MRVWARSCDLNLRAIKFFFLIIENTWAFGKYNFHFNQYLGEKVMPKQGESLDYQIKK